MRNPRWLTAIFLSPVLLTLALSQGIVLPTIAQQGTTSTSGSWQSLFDLFNNQKEPRDPGPGGTGGPRPANLCWIAPIGTLWNDRPLFVWRGDYRSIGVREKGTQQILGRGRASSAATPLRWRYTGIALQPGKSYEWLFFFSQSSTSPLSWVPFKVMDTKSRNPITTDLNKLVAKLKAEGASQEEIALQRANYFAKRQLWADVLQEVYSVNNPSEQLQQVAREIEAQACQSKK